MVAVGSEDPTSDATVAATVLAVGVACDGFTHQTVVAEVDDPAAAQTLTDACEGQVEVVGDDVIADMLAMWMARPGAAELMRELLSTDHVRLTFSELPEARGRSFASVSASVDDALPIGIRTADGSVSLNPPPETIVAPGDLLVCLGDGSRPRWDGSAGATGRRRVDATARPPPRGDPVPAATAADGDRLEPDRARPAVQARSAGGARLDRHRPLRLRPGRRSGDRGAAAASI